MSLTWGFKNAFWRRAALWWDSESIRCCLFSALTSLMIVFRLSYLIPINYAKCIACVLVSGPLLLSEKYKEVQNSSVYKYFEIVCYADFDATAGRWQR